MSRSPDPRVLKAFNAMKSIGIKADKVKPVLKRLLRLFDKNWELIELDNYRALADAIFESEEEKEKAEIKLVADHGPPGPPLETHHYTNQPAVENDLPEPPLKKHHGIDTEDEASSTMHSGNMLDMKNEDMPQRSSAFQSGASTFQTPRAPKIEASSSSVCLTPRNEGKDPISIKLSSEAHQVADGRVISADNTNVTSHAKNAEALESEKPLNYHRNFQVPAPGGYTGNESLRSGLTEQHVKKQMSGGSETSSSFVASHQQPASLSLFVSDISKATETVNISLIDETIGQNEQLPNFVYIPSSIVYQSAYLHVSLARIADEDCCSGCRRDCLSSAVPCACARDTGGEFAYTVDGLVKEDFLRKSILINEIPQKSDYYYCKDCPLERVNNNHISKNCEGHLIKKFIKECWRKCGCNMNCGNRVVQRGISRSLQVFLTSDGKGWGVRTLEELPKGAFVCEYVGEILTNLELFERNKQNGNARHTYTVLLDADWDSESVLKDEDALCLDATSYGNVSRFINHRCNDANLVEIPVEVENPDHHYYHLAFFTKRKVKALEELTWDYKIDFADQSHPVKAFTCCCGSPFCSDKKGKGVQSNASKLIRQPSTK